MVGVLTNDGLGYYKCDTTKPAYPWQAVQSSRREHAIATLATVALATAALASLLGGSSTFESEAAFRTRPALFAVSVRR